MNKRADEYRDKHNLEDTRGGQGSPSIRRLKTFESFKTPAYRIYYGAMAGQWFTISLQMIARSILIYRLTGSGTIIGVMSLSLALPILIVSLLGGAIADRLQKKYILLTCQAASSVLTLSIALALSLGYMSVERSGSWWLLIVTAVIQGSIMGFTMPATMAIIPEIVSGERVMNAISLSTMGQMVCQLIGPALAGFLIDAYGFATIYYLMTGISIVATFFTFFLPRTSRTASNRVSPLKDMLEGFRYIRREHTILLVMIFGIIHRIAGMPFQYLLPIFTEDILDVGASGMGILMTTFGVGALLGSLILASLPNKKRGALLLLSGVIMGIPILVFSFSEWWYLSLIIVPFIGLGPTIHMTLTATIVQYYVEPDYRGRMQSFSAMGIGFASLGTFIAGVLSEVIGVQWSLGGMAIFLTLASLGFLIFARQVTRLE